MAKEPKEFKLPNPQTFAKTKLRSASLLWPGRTEALKRARVGRGLYLCASCNEAFPRKAVQLDHIEPVVDIKLGWTGFDDWISRLFCPPEGFRVLCVRCHDSITVIQDQMREFHRKKRKE